ncbi:MAG TPA: hypothetical protein V6D12_06640 [Candidatus Obscuribacterales bacterium]
MSFGKEFLNARAIISKTMEFLEDGKKYYGEVSVTDNNHRLWEIKVRYDNNRKRYLKLEIKDSKKKFRATADNYKPHKYVKITPKQWSVFYELVKNERNTELYNEAKKFLDSF